MSLPTAAIVPTRAAGLTPATGARVVAKLREAGLVRQGERLRPPMWTETDYINYLIATATFQDVADVADKVSVFGALEYATSPGAPESDQRALLGPGALREVLIRLLTREARRQAGLEPDRQLPPWPQIIRFRLSPPTAEFVWSRQSDTYMPPLAERRAPPSERMPTWRQGGMVARIVDAPITLISATAEALLSELGRHGVKPAAHLSSDRRPST